MFEDARQGFSLRNLKYMRRPAFSLYVHGILGVGPFVQDCGSDCVAGVEKGQYFSCTTVGNCTPVTVSLTQQVRNPVASFVTDNNGVILELPACKCREIDGDRRAGVWHWHAGKQWSGRRHGFGGRPDNGIHQNRVPGQYVCEYLG